MDRIPCQSGFTQSQPQPLAKLCVPDRHFLIKNMILSQIEYLTFQWTRASQIKLLVSLFYLLIFFVNNINRFSGVVFSFKDKQSIICKLPSQTLIPPYKTLYKAADRSGSQSINLDLSVIRVHLISNTNIIER